MRKHVPILIAILMSCIALAATDTSSADTVSISEARLQYGVEGGFQLGHMLESTEITDRWGSFPGISGGLWTSWQAAPWLKLSSGIQYVNQKASSRREHPYPYVFSSDVVLGTKSLRVPFTLNARCFGWMNMPELYIGGGLYADIPLGATLQEKKHYLYTNVFADRDVGEYVPDLLPGWQAQIGSSTGNSYLELRANFSLRPFSIGGLPTKPLRQVSYSLVYCLRLDNELFH